MAATPPERHRVQCANEAGGREAFELRRTDRGIAVKTPGALTHTQWSREQAVKLRDTLTALLNEGGAR